jgi:hypothetical protein
MGVAAVAGRGGCRPPKHQRDTNHSDIPHQCAGTLGDRLSRRRWQAGALGDKIALGINLNRNVSQRGFFVDCVWGRSSRCTARFSNRPSEFNDCISAL